MTRSVVRSASSPHGAGNDVYLAYRAALNEQAKALIALEESAGIWDIDF